ncbi:hypothetical protein E4634_19425 [Mangrovimicrobium sediminis]|uniref:Energy transducer TonB n=1 Tax=Mangrovimicrobium sediminis TaxID=2562682 RepID=A0A4Z0LV42_9GAMM|nr:hypothetical protein [Haliea sp. SAOS-164]TGD71182.1 hypothetical protein E4634_19425 [Haliea sp. SAOS-164]
MDDRYRMHYLQAMGIDAYTARYALPGAAPSRLVPVPAVPEWTAPAEPEAETPVAPPAMPTPDMPVLETRAPRRRETDAPAQTAPTRPAAPAEVVRFSLAAVFCGGLAWVELLPGRPLAREQVKLIHAMARAVGDAAQTPLTAQFDWPMHTNQQFDLGVDAARDSVAAFLARQLQEQQCRALVLLGEECLPYIGGLGDVLVVKTRSTVQMFEEPACKRQVWRDLRVLAKGA